jgi:membrane associated rhomboid family serine protease
VSDPHGARRTLPYGIVAAAIALAFVAAYAWLRARGSPSDPVLLVAAGAAERGRVWHGQAWRLLTGSFLHADGHHLAVNGLGLALAGRAAERALGRPRFLVVYAAGVLGGASAALLLEDAVQAGASAGLFGVLAALLVKHYRTLGGLRPFLRSRMSWLAIALVAEAALPALLPGRVAWGDFLPVDHLAQMGGFLSGGAAGIAVASARPRPSVALPVAALLAALVGAACWPRPGPTAFEATEMESRIDLALRAEDLAAARRLLDESERRGLRSDPLTVYRAFVSSREGDLEGGLALLRPLAGRPPGRFRDEVRRQIARVAYLLGYQHTTGEGRPLDAQLGLAYLDEACDAGDGEACRIADSIRGEGPPPGP